MRGSRRAVIAAGVLLLAGCGSGEDLKSRWLVLPKPPDTTTHDGIGTSQIRDLDLSNWTYELNSITALDAFDEGIVPERSYANPDTPIGGYEIDFADGLAEVELGPDATKSGVATIRLSFDEGDVYYSDANGDGDKDAMIVLDQTVLSYESDKARAAGVVREERSTTSLLLLTYSEESIGDVFYVNTGPITDVSALDAGFTVTTEEVGGYTDTIEVGWPQGIPVRVDDHGGALRCTDSLDDIQAALEQTPLELEVLNAYPDVGEIPGYNEHAVFPLPVDPTVTNSLLYAGYERVVFLLDGGDISRWTDYRCGWAARSDL